MIEKSLETGKPASKYTINPEVAMIRFTVPRTAHCSEGCPGGSRA